MYKNATNHGLFGPWANELCTHIQKYIVKRIWEKNHDNKFVDQSWPFELMV